MTTLYEYPKFRAVLRVTLNTETPEYTRLLGTGGLMEIHDDTVTVSAQDGLDHSPCTPGWPTPMRTEYAEKWHAEHDAKPGTQSILASKSFYAPPDYDLDREHLGNFFNSVRTRKPSVEDATFGNNTAIACHMANYSYFQKTVAVWDAGAKKIQSYAAS